MTREEIKKRMEDLSHELYCLGRICTDQHFEEEPGTVRDVLYLAGEFLKNTTYTMDSYIERIEG